MRHKFLKVAALFVAGAFTMNAWAQTDVTSLYLVNPSFEILKASDGTTDVTVKTNLTEGLYGWSVVEMNNFQIESFDSKSSTGFPADGSGQITPTDGSYYYFNRKGWGNLSSERMGQFVVRIDNNYFQSITYWILLSRVGL